MFLLVVLLPFVTVKVEAAEDNYTISPTQNAMLLTVGETVPKEKILLKYNNALIDGTHIQFADPSSGLTITETGLTATSKGRFQFLLQYQSLSMYVYVFAKEAAENDYLLFEETFTYNNGSLPSGYNTLAGHASIDNNRLKLDGLSGSAMVLFPEYLKGFSNYVIETDFTLLQSNNSSRWASVLFRYNQKEYFQMAIRQNATATDGVEFAKMINNQWNVPMRASFTEAIDSAKSYRLKIEVLGSTVKEYINDQLLISYDLALDFKSGHIGVQANGSVAVFDNFKITLPNHYISEDEDGLTMIADVYNPTTKIVNPPTILTRLNSKQQLEGYVNNKRPATLIMNMDASLNVVNQEGNVIDTLDVILKAMQGQMIPAIETDDVEIAALFAQQMKRYAIIDYFVISSKKEVIIKARDEFMMSRGVLKIDTLPEKLIDIRSQMNEAQAVGVLLKNVDHAVVHYLQHRLTTVFVEGHGLVGREKALLSGANGILTDDPVALIERYEQITTLTHIREVFFIAHRGLHNGYNQSLGPENSLEVALEAYQRGAKILETDVHLTADEEVVVMHDDTTNRTAEESYLVRESFLEILQQVKLKDISNTGQTHYIPSFAQYLDAFKGKDVVLFIEIKPTNKLLLEKVHAMIESRDMVDQVVLIMFGAQNALFQQDVNPKMSNGHLVGGLVSDSFDRTLFNVLVDVVPLKTTFNPSYGGLNEDIIAGLNHRGITTWPWTVDNMSDMSYLYHSGVGGITTNNFDFVKDNFINLTYEVENYTYHINDKPLSITGSLVALDNKAYPNKSTLILVDDGGTGITFEGNTIKGAKNKGIATFYTKSLMEFSDGTTFEKTSPLFSVEVSKPQTSVNHVGLILMISSIAIVSVGAFILFFKLRGGKQ